MPVDVSLLLQSVHAALINGQSDYGLFLLNYASQLSYDPLSPSTLPFDSAIALDRGLVRERQEDCIFAVQGCFSQTQDVFGLYIVCDGMGGHLHGQEAARCAIETMVSWVFPHLLEEQAPCAWSVLLTKGVQAANHAIYQRNQGYSHREGGLRAREGQTGPIRGMGTTLTAALIIGNTACIVNVGDSRAYLYHQPKGLQPITRDHSIVARMVEDGVISPDAIYTHPKRNQIYRCLGERATVDVDTFVVEITGGILLLCSDGLWEMTRDEHMRAVLDLDWACAPYMANRLLSLAKAGGAKDNVGLVVVQVGGNLRRTTIRRDISQMETAVFEPLSTLTRMDERTP